MTMDFTGTYPSALLEKYELLELLSKKEDGAETILARARESGQSCIVKCFAKDAAQAEEGGILSRLAYPLIPKWRDTYTDGTCCYLVRDYIEGCPLDRYREERHPGEKQALSIAISLCDTLSYLHAQQPPVIHRDVKPQNIIIGMDERPYLIDFGIAREYDPDSRRDTQALGTAAFCPPEQYGYAQTDARTDVYALGMVLLYMLTGEITLPDAYARIRKKEVAEVVRRSTAFAPKDRYASAAAFQRALLQLRPQRRLLRGLVIASAALLSLTAALLIGIRIGESKKPAHVFGVDDAMWVTDADPALIEESVAYLNEKFGTDFFTADGEEAGYVTNGTIRDMGVRVFGLDGVYMQNLPEPEPRYPHESDHSFFPWIMEDDDRVDKRILTYCVVKFFWPARVGDWESLMGKEDTGEYPGIRVAEPFVAENGIFDGVGKHDHYTMGELAVIMANAAKAYENGLR
ncbi:MAG: serine/threonine-protein kinase [Clostridia bacterium]|nr:serine/threonine-protein kinase [Clostridia bacterium]